MRMNNFYSNILLYSNINKFSKNYYFMLKLFNYFLVSIFLAIAFVTKAQTAEEYLELAVEKTNQQDYVYALGLVEKAIRLEPDNYDLYLEKSILLHYLGQYANEEEILLKAIKVDSENYRAYMYAGDLYYSQNMLEESIMMYDMAILKTEDKVIKTNLKISKGHSYFSVREFEKAIQIYLTILENEPDNYGALNNIGITYLEMGAYEKAMPIFKKLHKEDPERSEPISNIGYLHTKLGNYEKAIEFCDKALKVNPDNSLVLNNRAYAYHKTGKHRLAISEIEKSLSIYPQNSYAYKNLALCYLALEMNYEACKALQFASDYGFEQNYGEEVNNLIEENCQ